MVDSTDGINQFIICGSYEVMSVCPFTVIFCEHEWKEVKKTYNSWAIEVIEVLNYGIEENVFLNFTGSGVEGWICWW
jgi:hypothetical protein